MWLLLCQLMSGSFCFIAGCTTSTCDTGEAALWHWKLSIYILMWPVFNPCPGGMIWAQRVVTCWQDSWGTIHNKFIQQLETSVCRKLVCVPLEVLYIQVCKVRFILVRIVCPSWLQIHTKPYFHSDARSCHNSFCYANIIYAACLGGHMGTLRVQYLSVNRSQGERWGMFTFQGGCSDSGALVTQTFPILWFLKSMIYPIPQIEKDVLLGVMYAARSW